MIKKINIEEIKKREEFLYGKLLTRKRGRICAGKRQKASVKKKHGVSEWKSFRFQQPIILSRFHQNGTECTRLQKNVEWTTGFWTGLIWLMYDWSREECFKELWNGRCKIV